MPIFSSGDVFANSLMKLSANCLNCGMPIVFEKGANLAKSRGIQENVVMCGKCKSVFEVSIVPGRMTLLANVTDLYFESKARPAAASKPKPKPPPLPPEPAPLPSPPENIPAVKENTFFCFLIKGEGTLFMPKGGIAFGTPYEQQLASRYPGAEAMAAVTVEFTEWEHPNVDFEHHTEYDYQGVYDAIKLHLKTVYGLSDELIEKSVNTSLEHLINLCNPMLGVFAVGIPVQIRELQKPVPQKAAEAPRPQAPPPPPPQSQIQPANTSPAPGPVHCHNCGTAASPEATFCMVCGRPLYAPAEPPGTRYRGTALVLWFVGGFGFLNIHNYYLGKVAMGISRFMAYCLTMAISGLFSADIPLVLTFCQLIALGLFAWNIVDLVYIIQNLPPKPPKYISPSSPPHHHSASYQPQPPTQAPSQAAYPDQRQAPAQYQNQSPPPQVPYPGTGTITRDPQGVFRCPYCGGDLRAVINRDAEPIYNKISSGELFNRTATVQSWDQVIYHQGVWCSCGQFVKPMK